MYNQHTRGMATTRNKSLVERGARKALLETLHTQKKKNPIFTNLKKKIDHVEFPAKLLDYFLRSNRSNINQSGAACPDLPGIPAVYNSLQCAELCLSQDLKCSDGFSPSVPATCSGNRR